MAKDEIAELPISIFATMFSIRFNNYTFIYRNFHIFALMTLIVFNWDENIVAKVFAISPISTMFSKVICCRCIKMQKLLNNKIKQITCRLILLWFLFTFVICLPFPIYNTLSDHQWKLTLSVIWQFCSRPLWRYFVKR